MANYSAKTRIELTPLGWLNVASRKLRASSRSQDKISKVKLKIQASFALSTAIKQLNCESPHSNALGRDMVADQ